MTYLTQAETLAVLRHTAEKAERELADARALLSGTVMGGPTEPIVRPNERGSAHICGYVHTGSGCNPTKLVAKVAQAERERDGARQIARALSRKLTQAERERDEAREALRISDLAAVELERERDEARAALEGVKVLGLKQMAKVQRQREEARLRAADLDMIVSHELVPAQATISLVKALVPVAGYVSAVELEAALKQ